jgi:hypothetical protein
LVLLKAIQAEYGGVIRTKSNARPGFTLCWSSIDTCKRIVGVISPYVIAKAPIIRLMDEFLTGRSTLARIRFSERDQEIFRLVSELNGMSRASKGAPEVLAA